MSKELFNELIITFMDKIFEDTLDLLDEKHVDRIIQSLSVLFIKDRYSLYKRNKWTFGAISDDLEFEEISQLAYNPNYERTLKYLSNEGNSMLYAYFFLTECRQIVLNSSEAFCFKDASQLEETKVIFFQMHELYNESIAFVSKPLQKIINDEVNNYLREIDL